MSSSKVSHLSRSQLAEAIGRKVERMRRKELVELASSLNVEIEVIEKAPRRRLQGTVSPARDSRGPVLQGAGLGPVVSVEDGRRLLDAIIVDDDSADWAHSPLVGAGDLVTRLSIARATLDNWRKARKVLALRKGLRNFLYPLRQFERRRPVDGLDKVAEHFDTAEDAWEWLVTPNRITGGKPPIDALHHGDVANVVRAASAPLDYA